jgi:hypothetical protein
MSDQQFAFCALVISFDLPAIQRFLQNVSDGGDMDDVDDAWAFRAACRFGVTDVARYFWRRWKPQMNRPATLALSPAASTRLPVQFWDLLHGCVPRPVDSRPCRLTIVVLTALRLFTAYHRALLLCDMSRFGRRVHRQRFVRALRTGCLDLFAAPSRPTAFQSK